MYRFNAIRDGALINERSDAIMDENDRIVVSDILDIQFVEAVEYRVLPRASSRNDGDNLFVMECGDDLFHKRYSRFETRYDDSADEWMPLKMIYGMRDNGFTPQLKKLFRGFGPIHTRANATGEDDDVVSVIHLLGISHSPEGNWWINDGVYNL